MPIQRDSTMLRVNSRKFLVAMAELEYEPADLAAVAGVPKNIVYTMRRGFYTKPKYVGKVAKALNVRVIDLLDDENEKGRDSSDNTGEIVAYTTES